MRILVTGSRGFVGQHVVGLLKQNPNYDVWTPSSQELNLLTQGEQWIPNEFSVVEQLDRSFYEYGTGKKLDAIIHLAGVVGGIGFNQNNQGKLGYENLMIGLNLLEAARIHGVKKVIMLGTTCSYPHTPRAIPFTESELFDGMPEMTNSGYGIAKRTLAKIGIEYSKQYGMQVVNLIPTNMLGEHDHFEDEKSHVIPALIKKFEREERKLQELLADKSLVQNSMNDPQIPQVILWGTGSASRDFLYAGDCAKAIVMALEKDIGPEPINLGTGQEVTIKMLAELIKKVGDYSSDIVWDSSKPDGQPRRCLSTHKAEQILGWKSEISLVEALQKTIKWYRECKTK